MQIDFVPSLKYFYLREAGQLEAEIRLSMAKKNNVFNIFFNMNKLYWKDLSRNGCTRI